MAYEKVPRPSTVYHLTQKGNLDSILDDGMIRRFNDTECWFCESLDKMKAYMRELDANLLRQSVRKITYGGKTVKVLLKNNQVLEESDNI